MSYPTDPEFSAINVTSRSSNVMTETRSGRRQVRSIGAQRWAFTAQYNELKREEFAPVFAFIMTLDGQLNTFTIVPPVISTTSGTATGTALTNGAHSIGDNTIAIDGITGTLKAGDFVKFSNHDKVYMVTADRNAAGILNIRPGLLASVADNTTITYNNVPFTMRLDNDVQEYSLSGFDRYQYEIDMVEAL